LHDVAIPTLKPPILQNSIPCSVTIWDLQKPFLSLVQLFPTSPLVDLSQMRRNPSSLASHPC